MKSIYNKAIVAASMLMHAAAPWPRNLTRPTIQKTIISVMK